MAQQRASAGGEVCGGDELQFPYVQTASCKLHKAHHHAFLRHRVQHAAQQRAGTGGEVLWGYKFRLHDAQRHAAQPRCGIGWRSVVIVAPEWKCACIAGTSVFSEGSMMPDGCSGLCRRIAGCCQSPLHASHHFGGARHVIWPASDARPFDVSQAECLFSVSKTWTIDKSEAHRRAGCTAQRRPPTRPRPCHHRRSG